MTPQELKNSILQLAIQGRLVEQRPEEGTAEELYRQIQREKAALVKAGKIKKEKPLPEITEEEVPFEIPMGWKWARFGSLSQLLDGEKKQGEAYPILDAKFLRGKSEATYVTNGKYIRKGTKTILVDGENSGEVFIVPQDGYLGSTFKVLYYSSAMYEPYVLYFLLYHKKDYRNNKKGSAIPHLNKELFFNMPIPLPPLAEQKRIVAKIEELLPYIDRYEAAWSRLEDFNKRFPTDMQKSILQLAIQGKLVEQRPEEGTGEELYQQIQAEKQSLIRSGKLKKEKPLPEITPDEIPFDIPESWKWVRLNSIVETIGDGIHGTPVFDPEGDYYFVNGNNLDNGMIVFKGDTQRVSRVEYEKYKKPLNSNTVMLSINGTIGNIAYYEGEPIILGKSACYIALLEGVFKYYIRTLLETQFFYDYAVSKATQTTIKNVSLKAIRMLPVPLPPLPEQKRIVAKLEKLLPLCDRLK